MQRRARMERVSGFGRSSSSVVATLGLVAFALAAGAQEPEPSPGIGLVAVVRLALDNDPNLGLAEARLRASRGALLSAGAPFDLLVSSRTARTDATTPEVGGGSTDNRTLEQSVALSKQFRTGFEVTPEVDLVRTDEAGAGPSSNLGTLSVTLRQPLLRGRGREAAAGAEIAAQRLFAASGLDLRQVLAERVLAVASQYWATRAAALALDILKASEESARQLLATTRRLIEGDVTPAADLVQVEANVAAKEALRIGGEQALFEARRSLGREIGLAPGAVASLPLPSDAMPELSASVAAEPDLLALALARRSDLAAARQRVEAAETLRRAARNALEPQLDLALTPSYTGLVEGDAFGSYFSPLSRNVPGLSSVVSLDLAWPVGNRQAEGDLLQREAERDQSARVADLLERQIAADVPVAMAAVSRQAAQLERASAAVRLFEVAVDNEEKKLRAGSSTLIDVISQRDRLTSARQSEVSSRLALALALAQLRFATGTLVPEGEDAHAIGFDDLAAPPRPPAAEGGP